MFEWDHNLILSFLKDLHDIGFNACEPKYMHKYIDILSWLKGVLH